MAPSAPAPGHKVGPRAPAFWRAHKGRGQRSAVTLRWVAAGWRRPLGHRTWLAPERPRLVGGAQAAAAEEEEREVVRVRESKVRLVKRRRSARPELPGEGRWWLS